MLKNGYSENFMFEKMFEKFIDNKHAVKVPTLTVEKKPLVLVLPLLDSISLEIMSKLKK